MKQEINETTITAFLAEKHEMDNPKQLFDGEFASTVKRHSILNNLFYSFTATYFDKYGRMMTSYKQEHREKKRAVLYDDYVSFTGITSMDQLITDLKEFRERRIKGLRQQKAIDARMEKERVEGVIERNGERER